MLEYDKNQATIEMPVDEKCPVGETCSAVGHQKVSVCVPVTVTPFANYVEGTARTKCCGDPLVGPGTIPCSGTKNGACTFTLSQLICVEVPVDFGANVDVGDTYVDCKEASEKDICKDCEEEDDIQ